MAHCKNCGAELQENARFCTKCGTPILAQPVERTETVPRRVSPVGPLAILGIVLIVLVAVAFVIALPLIFGGLIPGGIVVGSGNVQTESRNVGDFSSVNVNSGFRVQIIQSNNFSVNITADDNVLPHVEVTKSGTVLTVRLAPGFSVQTTTLRAEIAMPTLGGVQLSGGSNVEVTRFSSSNDLTIDLSGGSHLTMTGGANNIDVACSGGSILDLSAFVVNNANVDFSGGSQGTINLNGRLNANLSGGSRLSYVGNPMLGDMNTSGGSTITHTQIG